jgi:predicted RNA-binding protein with TRAM domain
MEHKMTDQEMIALLRVRIIELVDALDTANEFITGHMVVETLQQEDEVKVKIQRVLDKYSAAELAELLGGELINVDTGKPIVMHPDCNTSEITDSAPADWQR